MMDASLDNEDQAKQPRVDHVACLRVEEDV